MFVTTRLRLQLWPVLRDDQCVSLNIFMVTMYLQFKPIRQQRLQHRVEFSSRRRFRGSSNGIYIEQFRLHPRGLIGDRIMNPHSVLEFKNIGGAHQVVESNRVEGTSPK